MRRDGPPPDRVVSAPATETLWRDDTCTVSACWRGSRILQLRWTGDVTVTAVALYLPFATAALRARDRRTSLLFDLMELRGFQFAVLQAHARAALDNLDILDRIAVATVDPAHRFGVATVNALQPITLRHFPAVAAALAWLDTPLS